MLSQSPRAVAARVTKQQQEAIEHEAHRKHMREMIARYGDDYSKWPENQSKLKSQIEDLEHEVSQ